MNLFAETAELLANESGSLKKIEIISNAISQIKDERELYLFCLYLTGYIFPTSVQKTINVGKALVRDAAIKLLGISLEDWNKNFREFGETGDAIENLFKEEKHETKEGISLPELSIYIDKLSETSGNLAKVDILAEILGKLDALSAKYATKLLLQNLRIGVQEPTVEAGIAKAFDVEKKEISHLNFYLGDIGEIAVRAKNKDFSNVEFRLFHPIKAMLASAEVDVDDIFKRMGDEVWCEYKYDGVRAHIHRLGDRVEIFTRDLKRITDQFPEVVEFYKTIKPDDFLIDGEIVPFSGGKIQPFAYVQKRLGRKESLEEEAKSNPAVFIAYDFLFYQDKVLFEKPLEDRRKLLETTFEGTGQQFSTMKIVRTQEEFHEFFRQSKDEGREGLMVKKIDSKYESGKRGINWLKYKQTLDPLDVVVLKADWGEGKNAKYLSSYTFGVYDGDKLVPIGRVASGATEEELKYFTEFLPTIKKSENHDGIEVQPVVILEVGFENIQKSERYPSGYAVRFPRILRIRTGDKPLEEINTLDDVKRIYKQIEGITTK